MTLPVGYEDITWYGDGPSESYTDRSSYAMTDCTTIQLTKVSIRLWTGQTSGNFSGVKWMALTGSDRNTGIMVAADEKFGGKCSALYYGRAGRSEASL